MGEMTEGYINLHRRVREHPYWHDAERLRAWLDILFMTAWKDHRRMVGTNQVELERGQFLASEPFLSKRWRWSRGKVRRFLKAAEEVNEIRPCSRTSDGTIYLVVKYDDYQDGRPSDGTGDDTSNGQAADIIEVRDKPEKKEQKKKTSSKKKTTLPDAWTPTERHQEKAAELDLSLIRESEAFKDHHLAKGSTFVDWDRAFNTWLRNANEFKAKKPAPKTPLHKDPNFVPAHALR